MRLTPIPGAMRSIEPGTHNPAWLTFERKLLTRVFMGPGLRFAHPGMGGVCWRRAHRSDAGSRVLYEARNT